MFCSELTLVVQYNSIDWYQNIFLSQYHNIVRQNVSCELSLNLLKLISKARLEWLPTNFSILDNWIIRHLIWGQSYNTTLHSNTGWFLILHTVKLGYNEHAWDRLILFVIAVIRYKDLCSKVAICDQKFQL